MNSTKIKALLKSHKHKKLLFGVVILGVIVLIATIFILPPQRSATAYCQTLQQPHQNGKVIQDRRSLLRLEKPS